QIFEATFEYSGVLVQVDILSRASVSANWEVIEVKSATQVKESHISDVATQLWVVRGAGLKVKSGSILHINNLCVYPQLEDLFKRVDVTEDAEKWVKTISVTFSKFQKMLAQPDVPDIEIGPHCNAPHKCDFIDHCWSAKKIPTPSIFDIPNLASKIKWELYQKKIIALADLDPSSFTPTQQRMIDCSVQKKRFVDAKAVQDALSEWVYPLSFLDFETINSAIPRFEGVTPFQQLPFQFSCHVQLKPGEKLTHYEYLHLSESDPRESIARELIQALPKNGSVVAYNKGFERHVLVELAERFSELSQALLSIASRLVDPWPVFRKHVYDPSFMGSFSIKSVAPALLGQSASYKMMAVGEGSGAQVAYLKLMGNAVTAAEKKSLKEALIKYCEKDTLGMAELVFWLQRQ
ncbi:MAG: DUF2779 domain-containing protein, partial [Bdellovibrionota bacterium]